MSYTEKKLIKTFMENTGKHFLDSGGEEGRAWQRNRRAGVKAFKAARVVTADCWEGDTIIPTVNTFHYLNGILSNDRITEKVNKAINRAGYCWAQEAAEIFEELHHCTDTEIGEAINTYNGECTLDHTLLYVPIKLGLEFYVALQVHLGADVRGGYSAAQIWKLETYHGLINPTPGVYGSFKDQNVSNFYNGYGLTYDETNEDVIFSEGDKAPELYLTEDN